MATWSFAGGGLKVGLTYTSTLSLAYDAPEMVHLISSARALHTLVPLVHVKFLPANPPTAVYRYTWKAVNGRTWDQQLVFLPEPIDPGMVFTHTDVWRESEFALHRPVRAAVQTLYVKYGLATLLMEFS